MNASKQHAFPRAILFDLDGTLADTAPDLARALNKVRLARSLEPAPYEALRPVASAGARGLIGAGFALEPGDEGFEELRKEFLENYQSSIAVETRLFEGVREMLDSLNAKGIAWGIVTNKMQRFTDILTPKIGLGDAACVVSGDTTPHSKPHPAPLLEAARRLNVRPEDCWYVGDDLRDIQAGAAANMTTVAAAWGYCGHTEPAEWSADMIADMPLSLLELLPPQSP
ncbi:MAG: phosphoglycolate phosphatase [Paucimonas sp.]|jgi:phosphoglycolate phosphatase|nr:phosphoglycolate phosphatase [Paucimonas sp.]